MEKAQASIEFIIMIALLSVVLLFSANIFSEQNTQAIVSGEQQEAGLVAQKVARAVNSVYLAGNGAETRLFLKRDFDYNVDFFDNAVAVSFRGETAGAPILTNRVTKNSLTPGGFISVSNSKGTIITMDSEEAPAEPPMEDLTAPVVSPGAPEDGATDTDGTVQFDYTVNDAESGIASCSLILNGSVDQTDSTVTEGITQSFTKTGLVDGDYTWSVECTDDSENANTGSSGERTFTVSIATGPQTLTLWAETALFGTSNTTGSPDNVFDSTTNGAMAASSFDVAGLGGTITQARLIWSHEVTGTLGDDLVNLSYGFSNLNTIAKTYDLSNTPIDHMDTSSAAWEIIDVTTARPGGGSWEFSDFANLQVGGEYIKSRGPDASWSLDAVGVEITYEP